MKRLAIFLLLLALPISAAEVAKVYCDDEACAMSFDTMNKLAAYIRTLEQKVADLRATTGCS